MTTLPKRNPFLLVVYFLAVIMMFVFVAWIVLYPYADGSYDYGYDETQYEQTQPATQLAQPAAAPVKPAPQVASKPAAPAVEQPQETVNTNKVAGMVPEQRQPLRLAGITTQLNLQRSLDTQINQAWERFAAANLLNKVEVTNSLQVYAVYHGYNQQSQSVRMTLGYVVGDRAYMPSGVSEIKLKGGRYLRLSGENVLDNWNSPQRFGNALKFDADYELYLLNENYQVLHQVAFLEVN